MYTYIWRFLTLLERQIISSEQSLCDDGYKPKFWKRCDSRFYDAILEQLRAHPWLDPLEFDPTLKQAFTVDGSHFIRGDDKTYDLNFKWFLNRLNKVLYANRSTKIQLPIFCVLERSFEGRWHFHTLIDRPPGITRIQLSYAIRLCWQQVPFAHKAMIIGPADQSWKRYLLKPSQKPGHYPDAFRWTNINLGHSEPITLPIVKRLHDKADQWDPFGKLNGHWQLVLNEAQYITLNGHCSEIDAAPQYGPSDHRVFVPSGNFREMVI